MIRKIRTFFTILFAHIIHFFSYLVPRSSNIWVCLGWHKDNEREVFADNSKYFFLYLQNKRPEVTSIWLAKDQQLAKLLTDQGLTAYNQHSFAGMYYALRARYTIFDAHPDFKSWKFTGGSEIVQLWHGKGMKKSGQSVNYASKFSYFMNPGFYSKYRLIIATSEKTAMLLSKTFPQSSNKIVVTGQPRTDIFFHNIPGSEIDTHLKFKENIKNARDQNTKKIILYAPTYRESGVNPITQLNLRKLNDFLIQHDFHFFIQLHPKFAAKKVNELEGYSNITNIKPGLDINPIMNEIDQVITDYSNIYIDFLLLDKEVTFYTYDETEYRKITGLHEDHETMTPGPHAKNFEELLITLRAPDTYDKKRWEVKKKLFAYFDGNASERIYRILTK